MMTVKLCVEAEQQVFSCNSRSVPRSSSRKKASVDEAVAWLRPKAVPAPFLAKVLLPSNLNPVAQGGPLIGWKACPRRSTMACC